MKKLNVIWLFLTILLFTSNQSAALTTTFEWDLPGSVMIKIENSSGSFLDLDADQTSFVYNTSATYGYIYIYAADGYTLINASTTDGSNTYTPNSWSTPPFISVYVGEGNGMNGKTIKVNCIKTERNDSFTVDVINGLDFLSATFASGLNLDLMQGENTYYFNPSIDGDLSVKLDGVASAYLITLDEEPVAKSNYGANYTVKIRPGCHLVIQVFESEADIPKDCKLTFEYGENMDGCIFSIFNRTTNKLYEPEDFVNNSLVFKGGNELIVNLISNDYSYTKFTLDGEDITDSFNSVKKYIVFTVPNTETAILKIEGTAKEYVNIDFTGYISGAEGVNFSLTYNGASIEIPEGEAITENITVGSYTLTPENAKKYTIPVSEKVGKIFFSPKEGYYIAELYTLNGKSMEQHSGSASIFPDSDGTVFYMIVKKLDSAYSFDLTTNGSTYTGRLSSANQTIMGCWNNPEGLHMILEASTKSVSFHPGYDVPALISVYGNDSMDPAVYLDGAPLTGVINSNSAAKEFTFSPYYPTENSGVANGVKSDVQVYLSTSRPTMSGASIELEEGASAEFFYSAVRHPADPSGQSVISGTTMIVKPASKNMIVKYKGETVTLNQNGEFVFEATGSARNNVVTVSIGAKYADMLVNPADGSTVKSLSTIIVTLPCIDPNNESMLDCNEEVLPQLRVKKGNEVVAEFSELGESYEDSDGNTVIPIILSKSITEAGIYTIEIPEKTFVEKAWSETNKEMVAVKDGFITPAYKGTVTVDPNAPSQSSYDLTPESGSTLEAFEVAISFPHATDVELVGDHSSILLTNNSTLASHSVNCMKDDNTSVPTFILSIPEDAQQPTKGVYTLNVREGTFSINGVFNSTEINAIYYINPSNMSIEYIFADKNGKITVYSSDGHLILENASASEIRNLPNGLYIINGVKAFLK